MILETKNSHHRHSTALGGRYVTRGTQAQAIGTQRMIALSRQPLHPLLHPPPGH